MSNKGQRCKACSWLLLSGPIVSLETTSIENICFGYAGCDRTQLPLLKKQEQLHEPWLGEPAGSGRQCCQILVGLVWVVVVLYCSWLVVDIASCSKTWQSGAGAGIDALGKALNCLVCC
jgi:hypothetical protein